MNSSGTLPFRNGQEISSRVAGYLLHKAGLFLLAGILVLAAWTGQVPIVTLTSLFLSVALLARAWARLSMKRVTCERTLSEKRIFAGESTELAFRLINRKPLPLPWFQLEQELPEEIAGEVSLRPSLQTGMGVLCHEGALLWYRSLRWRCRLNCRKRGYYRIGSAECTSGDLFGLYSRSMRVPLSDELIVYPRIFSLEKSRLLSLQPAGEFRTRCRMAQDPTRPMGVRDYRYGDSLRHIHWKASARARQLQVKVFESTTSFKVALFLSVESFRFGDSFDEDAFELAISTAASIAYHVTEQGSPAGVFVNTRAADSGAAVSVAPAGSREQVTLILEALAKVTPAESEAFEAFLERERQCLTAGTTLVLLLGRPPESLPGWIRTLESTGSRALLLVVGNQEGVRVQDGISWERIRSPHDLARL